MKRKRRLPKMQRSLSYTCMGMYTHPCTHACTHTKCQPGPRDLHHCRWPMQSRPPAAARCSRASSAGLPSSPAVGLRRLVSSWLQRVRARQAIRLKPGAPSAPRCAATGWAAWEQTQGWATWGGFLKVLELKLAPDVVQGDTLEPRHFASRLPPGQHLAEPCSSITFLLFQITAALATAEATSGLVSWNNKQQ